MLEKRNKKFLIIITLLFFVCFFIIQYSEFIKKERILTGTLLEIGTGKREASKLPVVIAAEDRSLAGFLAPARGLFLRKVYY